MIYRIRRILLGSLTLFLFGYLLLHTILNVSGPVRQFQTDLSQHLRRPVDIGYVYLNWKGRPSFSHLRVKHAFGSNMTQPFAHADDIEISIAWHRLVDDIDRPGPFEMIDSIQFGHLDINLDKPPDRRELFEGLPPIPTHVSSWSIEYFNDNTRFLRMRGKNMRYQRPRAPVTLDIKSILGESARIHGRLQFLPVSEWDFDVQKMSLPESSWPLADNEWHGSVHYDSAGDTGLITANLSGNPGQFRNIQFPTAQIVTRIQTASDTTSIESLRFTSDYANFDWTGTTVFQGDQTNIDLRGDLFINFEKFGETILNQLDSDDFNIIQAFPLHGKFHLGGTLQNPKPSGSFTLRRALVDWQTADTDVTLALSDWSGELTGDQMELNQGGIESILGDFQLSNGYLDWERKGLLTSLTGHAKTDTLPLELEDVPGQSVLGPFAGMESRVNMSTIFDKQSSDFVLAFENGSVQFSRGSFRSVNLITTFSSLDPIRAHVKGDFQGPGDNPWLINGNHNTLRLRSRLNRLDGLSDLLLEPGYLGDSPVELTGAQARIQLTNPFKTPVDYAGFLEFDGSSIRSPALKQNIRGLSGEVTLKPSRIQFNELFGSFGRGNFQITGNLSHDTVLTEGNWNVDVSGADLPFSGFLPAQHRGYVNGRLDLDGTIRGKFREPVLTSEISSGQVKAGIFSFESIRGQLTVQPGSMKLSDLRAQLAGKDVFLESRLVHGKHFRVRAELKDMPLSEALEPVDYFREQTRGKIDLDLEIEGSPESLDTWQGNVSLQHRDIVLAKFPEVPGLERVARSEVMENPIVIQNRTVQLPIRSGQLRLEPLKLVAKGLELNGRGYININGNLDSRFVLTLKQETLRGFLRNVLGSVYHELGLSDDPRHLDIPFTIKETVFSPRITLDNDKVAQNIRADIIQNFIPAKLGGKLLDELLGEIFD